MKKILVLNWKDTKHPDTGGAEVVTHELLKRLVKDGHEVTLLTARYKDSTEKDDIDGVNIIHVGKNKLSHYFAAASYYKKNLKNQFDIVIEEVNTLPYLFGLYKGNETYFLFYHMLAREIWFYEMIQPLSTIGYLIEPIYTWIQGRFGAPLITISQSTKDDIKRFGVDERNIRIISEGIDNNPLSSLAFSAPKEQNFTVLFHSSLRNMKRPIEVFKAFGVFVKDHPKAKLWISGGGDQNPLKEYAIAQGFNDSVTFFGRTSQEQKLDLMQRASVICSTSIKEGWGLIVTEANSMGTPAVSYDVDGLRDSTSFGGGVVCKPDHVSMAKALTDLSAKFYDQPIQYLALREKALASSKLVTFEQSYSDLKHILRI
jgi:glycosyltransferase involved in cell wall biosynthesis